MRTALLEACPHTNMGTYNTLPGRVENSLRAREEDIQQGPLLVSSFPSSSTDTYTQESGCLTSQLALGLTRNVEVSWSFLPEVSKKHLEFVS